MKESEQPQSSIILYQTADGRTRIQCRFENETVWLTQALMAELFQVTTQNVTLHLKAIYAEGELDETATCKKYLQVRTEGDRRITRALKHYSLPIIIAVGYRVRSDRGTQFRQWATCPSSKSHPGQNSSSWTIRPRAMSRIENGLEGKLLEGDESIGRVLFVGGQLVL